MPTIHEIAPYWPLALLLCCIVQYTKNLQVPKFVNIHPCSDTMRIFYRQQNPRCFLDLDIQVFTRRRERAELHLEEGGRAIVTLLTPGIVIKVWLVPLSKNLSFLRTSKVAHQPHCKWPCHTNATLHKAGRNSRRETWSRPHSSMHKTLWLTHYNLYGLHCILCSHLTSVLPTNTLL